MRLGLSIIGLAAGAAAGQTQAVRGIAEAVEVDYPDARLVAKAGQTPTSPVLVRVVPAEGSSKQRIEFMGVTAGSYDLRDYVQRQDGQPATGLPGLPVRVVSQLPPAHGTDLFLVEDPGFSLRAHYRQLLFGAIFIWGAVPVVALVRRAMRKPAAAPAQAPVISPPTVADQLRGLMDSASARPLTIEEQGRLELLLFQFFADDLRPSDDPVQTIQLLRDHPRTRDIVAAVEGWLHGRRDSAAGAHAASMLRAFRLSMLGGDS
jgi:hypothetical protein